MNSVDEGQVKTRSKTEFEFWLLSENLVGNFLVGLDRTREKEFVISNNMSLWMEWNGKLEFYRLSLMLKSPIMMITLLMLVSVSLRYFKAIWDESK